MSWRFFLPIACFFACATPAPAPIARGEAGCAEQLRFEAQPVEGATALERSRVTFRNTYGYARSLALAAARPVIVVHFRHLVLVRREGAPLEEAYIPELYDTLSALSHVPLAIFAAGRIYEIEGAQSRWAKSLEELRGEIVELEKGLDQLGLPAELRGTEQTILRASRELIDGSLAKGSLTREEVGAFAAAMEPLVMQNSDAAAAAMLARVHEIVERWRKDPLTDADWAALKVVIPVPRMPREGYAQHQYFVRRFGSAAIDERIFFAEGLWGCDDALSLIGTIAIDRDVAVTFFRDPRRMDRDLLSDSAKKYLDQLFPGN